MATTAQHPDTVPTIAASRAIAAQPHDVHAFLADLGNHGLLGDDRIVLSGLREDGRGGHIWLRGPGGLRRLVRATVTRVHAPSHIGGRAKVGRRTRVHVSWRIAAGEPGAVVQLHARVLHIGLLDRVLLTVGGRRWLHARFDEVLARLAAQLEVEPSV
jgi:hypothetical protein